jgi:CHASE2 domain-containing sensor protein
VTEPEAAEPVGPDAVSPPPARPTRGGSTGGGSAVGWDLSHVRAGLLTTGVLAAVGVPLTWLVLDGRAAVWVLAGLAIVAAFFSVSAYAVAAAGRVSDSLTLPVALGTYVLKIGLLGVLLVVMRGRPWLDPKPFGLAIAIGTVAWTVMHARRVWTAQLYYVDPPPR